MILRDIYVYVNEPGSGGQYCGLSNERSRSLCNYIARHLRTLRFRTEGFCRICIEGSEDPEPEAYVNASTALIVEIPFDTEAYGAVAGEALNDFFIEMLHRGVEKAEESHAIPGEEILSAAEDFKAAGYRNTWTYQSKLIRGMRLRWSLDCEVTMTEFTLALKITRGDDLLFDEVILRTLPDELMFVPNFKDVKIDGTVLRVRDKFQETTFEMDLNDLPGVLAKGV